MRIILGSCKPRVGSDIADKPLELALRDRQCDVFSLDWQDQSVDWSEGDAIFVRTTWTWMENPPAFRQWIDHISTKARVFNSPALIQWNLDKQYLQFFEERQIATVPSLFLDQIDLQAIERFSKSWQSSKVILKSSLSAGAISQHRIDMSSDDLTGLTESALPKFGKVVVQPFLESIQTKGEISAIYINGRHSHSIVKKPRLGDYRVQSEYGAVHAPVQMEESYRGLAEAAVAALPEPALVVRIDMVEGIDGKPCLIEVEAVEPDLAWFADPLAAGRLADQLLLKLSLEDLGSDKG